jgi:hypothetical protein
VTFPARSSVWRYDIFAGGQPAGKYSIGEHPAADGASASGGERPAEPLSFAEVFTGRSDELSVAFESDPARLIPMRVRPAHQFQLVRDGRVIVEALPTPALSLNRSARGDALCSRMFVHL